MVLAKTRERGRVSSIDIRVCVPFSAKAETRKDTNVYATSNLAPVTQIRYALAREVRRLCLPNARWTS
jgi:hypothetical protein